MKSSLALAIFIIDLLGGIVILILTICIMGTQAATTRRLSQNQKIPNLRVSKLNLSEIHFKIKNQEKKNKLDLSNLDGDEFVLSHKQISSQSLTKRKLEDPSEEEIFRMIFVLLLNLLALHFTFVIGFSFLVDQMNVVIILMTIYVVLLLFVYSISQQHILVPRLVESIHQDMLE